MNQVIYKTIANQTSHQSQISHQSKKDNGVFFTNEIRIIDSILDVIEFNNGIINKKILEPAVGNGIFLLRTIERAYQYYPSKEKIKYFIENGLFFIDVDPAMIRKTKENIAELYKNLFSEQYKGGFNAFVYDFTEKVKTDLTLFNETKNPDLENLLQKIDYVIGNPPYVTLYGRRDRKRNELQRINYLSQYRQFPQNVKNGKINYVMLFIEHSLDYLKKDGRLAFIIDISFFETAYKYTRKYLLENTKIIALENNISNFDGVASGQLIIKIENNLDKKNTVTVKDFFTEETQKINQVDWLNENDEYRFRLNFSDNTQNILEKINKKAPKTLKEQFPQKAIRTCAMLLDMENKFVSTNPENKRGCKSYKYYQGSKALYDKYCIPFGDKYFYYDKKLQDKINDELKEELVKKGIKNKKRIGLGDFLVYDNPKIFIRQSAKEIIATYDKNLSSANNSLYVFSLRKGDNKTKEYLRFLCGYLNSSISTFYAQKMEVIRYRKGKQPQIKTSDLYSIPVPTDLNLIQEVNNLVSMIYKGENKKIYEEKINSTVNDFFGFSVSEIEFINNSILDYLKS
ncbi:MAG: hypothetical protein HY096_13865 [Nitrospinae bacterium]|nr:hypothetical protein [Nitrospinota bacterium]